MAVDDAAGRGASSRCGRGRCGPSLILAAPAALRCVGDDGSADATRSSALLTDFGTRDHYVGAVKGAILAACPEATDRGRDPRDRTPGRRGGGVRPGARRIAPSPAATVVRRGGRSRVSGRRAAASPSRPGGYRFVGPDNGLFTLVLADHPVRRRAEITNAELFRSEVSATFHARDVFGPVAGHLAERDAPRIAGPGASATPVALPLPGPVREAGDAVWEAEVIHVDRFGNLTTNLTPRRARRRSSRRCGEDRTA